MLLKEIEKKLEEYFPKEWSRGNILFWIGDEKFSFDLVALNKNLNKPIRDFVFRGGKRWRPTLFLTTLELFGFDWKKYLDVAVALELAHNGTLMIDDLEDDAELRRGKPVAHKIFGVDVAVNTGVTIHFLPLQILQKRKYKSEKQKLKILQIYSEEMVNVYFGQTLDIFWHNNPKSIINDQYLEMCRLKTGGLVRMAVRMACTLADKSEEIEKSFQKFAESVGIAFQIKDDALEFTSDEKTFGKSFGNDISEGKISLPVIFELKKIDEESKKELLRILKLHTKDKDLVKKAFNAVKNSGAVEKSIEYADKLIDEAWSKIISKLPKKKFKELDDFKKMTYSLVKREK